jgi:hypothetical protein
LTTDLNLDQTARSSRRGTTGVILGLALFGRVTEESKKF